MFNFQCLNVRIAYELLCTNVADAGLVDAATVHTMKMRRCGIPDIGLLLTSSILRPRSRDGAVWCTIKYYFVTCMVAPQIRPLFHCSHQTHLILTTQAWKQTLPPSDSDTVLYVSECLVVDI